MLHGTASIIPGVPVKLNVLLCFFFLVLQDASVECYKMEEIETKLSMYYSKLASQRFVTSHIWFLSN